MKIANRTGPTRVSLCRRLMRLLLVAAATAVLMAAGVVPASAVLRVDITRGNVDPMPVAITSLRSPTGEPRAQQIGENISRVVTADLQRSGLFRPVDPEAFIGSGTSDSIRPRFGDWRAINAQALVTGKSEVRSDGRLQVEFRLWDVFAEQQMTGLSYTSRSDNWRRIAHIIADAVYSRLTGESGYFDSRVVYVAESGPRNRRVKRLAIMDQDGESLRFLTNGDHLVLTPRFSPTAQEITYLSYFGGRPRVYLYNIDSGKQEVLGDFPGMTFAPRFSFDGNSVVMSMARAGNSDLYLMDLRTRSTTRLTTHPAIDTSPSISPDGDRIVFNSDRGGSQQLYVMNVNGSQVRRISFGRGRYATPVWSPRGDLIAFTKMAGGKFHIGIMRTDGSGERLLTESFLDEGPTWAPNGRVLMFFRQTPYTVNGEGGETRLWSIDLTGYNEREILTPVEASDPAWSPLIR